MKKQKIIKCGDDNAAAVSLTCSKRWEWGRRANEGSNLLFRQNRH